MSEFMHCDCRPGLEPYRGFSHLRMIRIRAERDDSVLSKNPRVSQAAGQHPTHAAERLRGGRASIAVGRIRTRGVMRKDHVVKGGGQQCARAEVYLLKGVHGSD